MPEENPRILAFAASARKGSLNKMLLQTAVAGAEAAGIEVTLIDLADYPLPVLDLDIEEADGIPERARAFKELMKSHDGFLIATPEHNGYFPAILKNLVDWCSRPAEGEAPRACFEGKTAAFLSASPGPMSGVRALPHTQQLFFQLGVTVLPGARGVGNAYGVFDENGDIKDAGLKQGVTAVGERLARALSSGTE